MQIFIVNSDDINGRLDCYYYQPSFTELEEKISKLTNKTLSDYIINMAGGATPDKDQIDKYYSDINNGIPFIRVQNLTPEGLNLSEVKYINDSTHNGLLKRSQVHESDLLIKITGVGRMAVSSVAPKDFIGNINQHIVVIKTKDKVSSDYLATFLNSDIGEMLAKRRSTGGTRPALDYAALKSIPIVWKPQIVQIIQSAYKLKQQKEKEAQELLDSIDNYVLRELNIQIPEIRRSMTYRLNSSEVDHKRMDVEYYQNYYNDFLEQIKNCKYSIKRLGEITEFIENGKTPSKEQYTEKENYAKPIIKAATASKKIVDLDRVEHVKLDFTGSRIVKEGDIFILSAAHQAEYVAKNVSMLMQQPIVDTHYVGELIGIRTMQNLCLPTYIFGFLSTKFAYVLLNREKRGQTSHLYPDDIRKIFVPVPPIETQQKIVNEIQSRRAKAEQLQKEAFEGLEQAKKQVEKMILSNN